MIIGFNGDAKAGKDTAASTLVHAYGFRRLAFADSLKIAARAIFGLTDAQLWGDKKDELEPFWGMTPRILMQRLGTECLRNGFSEDVWIKSLFKPIADQPHEHYVITDVRFENEARTVLEWGGKVYRIIRPGNDTRIGHASETALDDWGWAPHNTILNDGTPADLARKVADLVQKM
jgi:hypothetical protein